MTKQINSKRMKVCKHLQVWLIVILFPLLLVGCNQDKKEIEALQQEIQELKNQNEKSDAGLEQTEADGTVGTIGSVETVGTAGNKNANTFDNGRVVDNPPARTLACLDCDDHGKSECYNCGGTGKNNTSSNNSDFLSSTELFADSAYSSTELWNATNNIVSRCLVCNGTGVSNCRVCGGDKTIVNKEYFDYVLMLKAINMTSGQQVFETKAGKTVRLIDCLHCKGEKKTLCIRCNGRGEYSEQYVNSNGKFDRKIVMCNQCLGEGKTICLVCNGNGYDVAAN